MLVLVLEAGPWYGLTDILGPTEPSPFLYGEQRRWPGTGATVAILVSTDDGVDPRNRVAVSCGPPGPGR